MTLEEREKVREAVRLLNLQVSNLSGGANRFEARICLKHVQIALEALDGYASQNMILRQQLTKYEEAKTEYNKEICRPFYLLRPKVFTDGDQWCVLHGDNIQTGLYAFGDSPEKAAEAFDAAFRTELKSVKT